MSEKKLPIKIVLPRRNDVTPNLPGGGIKLFGEYNEDVQNLVTDKLNNVLDFYKDLFKENKNIPAIGKIKVKSEAIAKSHRPNELCKYCPIIGGSNLDEIYIKVTEQGIKDTIELINNSPSQKLIANMTTILDISPIDGSEKISDVIISQKNTADFNNKYVKVKLFDIKDSDDKKLLDAHINNKIKEFKLDSNIEELHYSDKLKLMKIKINSYEDISNLASINGVKSIDFFPQYTLPTFNNQSLEIESLINSNYENSDTIIGIIDSGISLENKHIQPHIYKRVEYVPKEYQNNTHATFIASTILFGNELNNITENNKKIFKLLDIVAIPNSDPNYGLTDSIGESDLVEIIEEVLEEFSDKVKIWNLSLGIPNKICNNSMSDLAIFLDEVQDKYGVQFFISSGNFSTPQLRSWPPQDNINENDRIISPAESVRGITVGSLALYDSPTSVVNQNEPSPFSRRGPGANYIVKPDLTDFGGNCDINLSTNNLGMKGLDIYGNLTEGIGTSYANPRIVYKFSKIYEQMQDDDLLLAKALLIHSARINSRDSLETRENNINYYGFGMPSVDSNDILNCSSNEITLIFKQSVSQGTHLEMNDFPFPESLIWNNKYHGEIAMTLLYTPPLDFNYGNEYCRCNIDVSFGTYRFTNDRGIDFKGQVPIEKNWSERNEQSLVANGFKWSPIKSYYRNLSRGISVSDGWKLRINMSPRNQENITQQEFILIITIKDNINSNSDIYSELVNNLNSNGYILQNLETRQQLRPR